jgi:beta-lactamase regulating signal transducer with metallopeptidase domain
MDTPLRLLLTNAAAAGLIALLAWAASLVVRRPAVVHGLWLLALGRLVMPPIAVLPLLPSWTSLPPAPPGPVVVTIEPAAGFAAAARTHAPPTPAAWEVASSSLGPGSSAEVTRGARSRVDIATLRAALSSIVGLGALAVVVLTAVRFARFGRLLRFASEAPTPVAARLARLASDLGLREPPPVRLVPARVLPMVWPAGDGPLLLLPAGLLADLREDERDALLAHELAHVRRRDHWVRLLELATTALFWWYPVTWWVRRSLRRAEERCCDECVLRVLPGSSGAYASGLLKSLTFLAVDPDPLPAMASGAGPVRDLEARLKEILMTRPLRQLPAPVRFLLIATALAGLAIFPTHAQTRPAMAPEEPTPTTGPSAPAPSVAATPQSPRVAAPAVRALRGGVASPGGIDGGVLGGVRGGIPGGIMGGLPGGVTALARRAAAPVSALAPDEQREFEEQRRALEEQRLKLHEQEMDLEQRSLELEARTEQKELGAEAARLRAEGKAAEAARVEKRAALHAQRVELQKRRLQLEMEHARLEAETDRLARESEARAAALEHAGQEKEAGALRAEIESADAKREQASQELEKKQQSLEAEMEQAERQIHAIEAEEHVQELQDGTRELTRSLVDQIQALREALADAPAQKAELEREIQRLEAALAALEQKPRP